MRWGLRITDVSFTAVAKESVMTQTELRRKLRACNTSGLFFRLITR